jgi:DNA-binding CsgD family transcriptional regulator
MAGRSFQLDQNRTDEIVRLVYEAALDARGWDSVVAAVARALEADRGIITPAQTPPAGSRGSARMIGSYLSLGDRELLTLAFYRSERRPVFGSAERRLLDQLTPHVARGLEIGLRLERLDAERRAAQAALDELTVGIALLDETGRVLHVNRTLAGLAEAGDGLSIAGEGLRAADPSTAASLRNLIARAVDRHTPSGGAVPIERAARYRPLHVVVAPIRQNGGERTWGVPARAIVLVSDPERHAVVPAELLRAAYGLTDAEARVATRIGHGTALEVIAEELGISLSTVRNHLKQIFEKTGTHRQAELVRLLHAGVLPIPGES